MSEHPNIGRSANSRSFVKYDLVKNMRNADLISYIYSTLQRAVFLNRYKAQ